MSDQPHHRLITTAASSIEEVVPVQTPRPLEVELCVATLAGVQVAAQIGADRVELCQELQCGGLTPTPELVMQAWEFCQQHGLALRILVRQLPDTFVHAPAQCAQLLEQIGQLRELVGDDDRVGFVTGALTDKREVDPVFLRECRAVAPAAAMVFHRAIDNTRDYLRSLEQVRDAGFNAVLTTGQGPRANVAGLRLARTVLGPSTAVIGSGGLREDNIAHVVAGAGLQQVHFRAPDAEPDVTDGALAQAIINQVRPAQRCQDHTDFVE